MSAISLLENKNAKVLGGTPDALPPTAPSTASVPDAIKQDVKPVKPIKDVAKKADPYEGLGKEVEPKTRPPSVAKDPYKGLGEEVHDPRASTSPEVGANTEYKDTVRDMKEAPPVDFFKKEYPDDLDIGGSPPPPALSSDQMSAKFAWLDTPPAFKDHTVNEIVSQMAGVWQDESMSDADKAEQLAKMQEGAVRMAFSASELIEKEGEALPSIRETAATQESFAGDVLRTFGGAGTAIMAMGNAFVQGVAPFTPVIPKWTQEWLKDNARSLSEQSANITEEIGKQGGIPAQVAQTIGEQYLTMAIRLALLKGAGLAGSQSIIVNSAQMGLITAATTPGDVKERAMAGLRIATLMATPVISGAIPSRAIGILADAALNVGLSNLYGFYNWKDPRSWIPALLIDVTLAGVSRPGIGKLDRAMLKNVSSATATAFQAYSLTFGGARALRDLHTAGLKAGMSEEQIAANTSKILSVTALEMDVAARSQNVTQVVAGDTSVREAEMAAQNKEAGLTGPPISEAPAVKPPAKKVNAESLVADMRAKSTALENTIEAQSAKAKWAEVRVLEDRVSKETDPGVKRSLVAEADKAATDWEALNTQQLATKEGLAYAEQQARLSESEVVMPPVVKPLPVKAVKPMPAPQPVPKSRYISGERQDKSLLKERLSGLPEVQALTPINRTMLAKAIDKYDGSIGSMTAADLGKAIRAVRRERPLKTAEELREMDNKELNSYIAGVLYKGKRTPAGATARRGTYLADMKKLGLEGQGLSDHFDKDGKMISRGLSREDRIRLAEYGIARFKDRLPRVDTVEEFKINEGLTRALQDTILDIQGARAIPHGPGTTPQDREVLNGYLSEGGWIKKSDPDGYLRQNFIENIEYPLPRDPVDRAKALLDYQGQLRTHIKAKNHLADPSSKLTMQKISNVMHNFASRFMMMDKLARETGNPKILSAEKDRLEGQNRGRGDAGRDFSGVFKKVGVHPNIVSYTSSKPEIESAIKLVIGVDPHSHSTKLRVARQNAAELIGRDSRGSEILKAAEGMRKLMNGDPAINTRILQTDRFGMKWDLVKNIRKQIIDIPVAKRTPKQKRKLAEITKTLKTILPWRFNTKTGKGEQVSVAKMKNAWNVYRARNEKATRAYMSRQDWGTRDYYYMSTRDLSLDSMLRPDVVARPSFEKSELDTPLTTSGRMEQRLGIPEFREGSPWVSIRHHIENLYSQSYTLDTARYVASATDDAANQGYISRWAATELNNSIKSEWGKVTEKIHAFPAKTIYAIQRSWWMAYGVIPSKMAYYTARNILYQGTPWGAIAGQYRAADIAKASVLSLSAYRDKNSFAMTHLRDDFKDQIALQKAVYLEGFLQFAHNERTRVPNEVVSKLQEWVGGAFALSDNWNRRYSTFTGDVIIEGYMDKFVSGRIGQSKLFHGLKLDALPEGHRRYLTDLFNRGLFSEQDASGKPVVRKENFHDFMAQTSELKTLFANYSYRINERSALEQNPNLRWFFGIPVYPRGTVEVLNETIARPIAEVWSKYQESGFKSNHFDSKKAGTAIGNLTSQIVGRAIASYIAGTVIGEKEEMIKKAGRRVTKAAYGLANSIASYGFLGPGSTDLLEMSENASKLVKSLWEDDSKTAMKTWEDMENAILYYSALVPALVPIMEAKGNRQGMKNLDVIHSIVAGEIKGGKLKVRDVPEAFLHAAFDTEPINREIEFMKLYNGFKTIFKGKRKPSTQWSAP